MFKVTENRAVEMFPLSKSSRVSSAKVEYVVKAPSRPVVKNSFIGSEISISLNSANRKPITKEPIIFTDRVPIGILMRCRELLK